MGNIIEPWGRKWWRQRKLSPGTQDFHSENIPGGGVQKFLGTVMLLLSKFKLKKEKKEKEKEMDC